MDNKIVFKNLDGLRFFAFFAVFVNHAMVCLGYNHPSTTYQFIKNHLLLNGDLGVNFFFVLSGFLITYLLLAEQENHGKINIKYFYMRRILRIWPVYFLVVDLCLFVFPLFRNAVPSNFPLLFSTDNLNAWNYMTFTGNFDYLHNGITNVLIGVLWSVSVEEQFYLFWPLVIFIIPKKYLLPTFISFVLGSIAFRYFFSNGGEDMIIRYHSFSSVSDLTVGAIVAILATKEKFIAQIKNTPKFVIISVYIIFIAILPLRGLIWKLGNNYIIAASLLPVLFSLFFAFIILEQNYSDNSFYKIGKFKTISTWGKYTYGMYCYHMILFFIVLFTFNYFGVNVVSPNKYVFLIEIILSLVFIVMVSKLSYTYFEMYFLKMKNKFLPKTQS